jgi:hypothetical protein
VTNNGGTFGAVTNTTGYVPVGRSLVSSFPVRRETLIQLLRITRRTATLPRFYGPIKVSFSMALRHLRSETIGVRRETNLTAHKADAAGVSVWFEQVDVSAGRRIPPPRSHNASMAATADGSQCRRWEAGQHSA